MVSTPELVTDIIPNVPMISTPVKKPSASKSLCLFTNIFDVKRKQQNVVLEIQNQNVEP